VARSSGAGGSGVDKSLRASGVAIEQDISERYRDPIAVLQPSVVVAEKSSMSVRGVATSTRPHLLLQTPAAHRQYELPLILSLIYQHAAEKERLPKAKVEGQNEGTRTAVGERLSGSRG
jgi:hypothetical protein